MKRIDISLGFGSLVCLLAWIDPCFCLWFVLGVLCHEAGHLLALWLCRVPVTGFSLRLTGAVIGTGWVGYRQELLCALAGPAASLLTAFLCCRKLPVFAILSGCFALVNLLPLYPLDGGRVLRAAMALLGREGQKDGVIRIVTYGTCGLLMLLACWFTAAKQAGIWPIFAALVILCRVGEANLRER